MISQRIHLPTCPSTQAVATTLIHTQQAQHGTLIHTDHQTHGYGLNGQVWESAKAKNLSFTLLLRPTFLETTQLFQLQMVAALALRDALHTAALPELCIKWPNDILCRQKKICGILVESRLMHQTIRWVLLGVGLNVLQTTFHTPHATSLACERAPTGTREQWLEQCLQAFTQRYSALEHGQYETLHTDYLKHLYRKDTWHTYENPHGQRFRGKITGIDDKGGLCMQTHEGPKHFFSKEIIYLF